LPVTRSFRVVITFLIGIFSSSSNIKSLFVTIPSIFLSLSTTGTPETLYCSIISFNCAIVSEGEIIIGSEIITLSYLLTSLTCEACLSIDIFLCMIPSPPCNAMAIAISFSVTVSIAALIIGSRRLIFVLKRLLSKTSCGITDEYPGFKRTSSNVNPLIKFLSFANKPPFQE